MTQTAARIPIAIVGIGCRFPGANTPQQFWSLLKNGEDRVTKLPDDRRALFQSTMDESKWGELEELQGGFIQNVDRFDSQFFGISAQEAISLDPTHRLLLEVVWEALEDGLIIPKQLVGTETGVFIGGGFSDYRQVMLARSLHNPHLTVGSDRSLLANRISYHFDLQGPSMTISTACSSSLVAVDLACNSLWLGESNLAIAGGAHLILSTALNPSFELAGMLSQHNRCKTFDASADGYVRSEGIGVVILKPLDRALADGNPIYAVIRGGKINQNSRGNGLTAPNLAAQRSLLQKTYAQANISPQQVQYVEVQGTGTAIGDTIEVKAIAEVMGEGRDLSQPCFIGTVKTNIGNAEAASGIASLIKVALSLHHQQIPGHLHYQTPNPHIRFSELPLQVPTSLLSWPKQSTPEATLAGVSAFGYGGTNTHLILSAAPDRSVSQPLPKAYWSTHLFTISAKTESALYMLVQGDSELLCQSDGSISLLDLCYAANTGRSSFKYRLFILAESVEQLTDYLISFLKSKEADGSLKDEAIDSIFTGTVGRRKRKQTISSPIYLDGDLSISPEPFLQSREFIGQSEGQSLLEAKIWPSEPKIQKQFLKELGQLWLQGQEIDWTRIYNPEYHCLRHSSQLLPTYPFERSSYWFTSIATNEPNSSVRPEKQNSTQIGSTTVDKETVEKVDKKNIEKTIAELWQQLLNQEDINVTDNFFQIGGTSLLATTFCAEASQRLNLRVPTSAIFLFPTIAQLIEAIQQGEIVETSLQMLTHGRSRPPIFSINSTSQMRSLANYLPSNLPFYNLNIFALSNQFKQIMIELQPSQAIGAIAAKMVEDICNAQSQGPYQLLTFCGDTHLTLEIAQQLQSLDHQVALVCMIDGILQNYYPTIHERIGTIFDLGPRYLSIKVRNFRKKLKLEKSRPDLKEANVVQDRAFYQAYLKARSHYSLKPYCGRTKLLLSSEWRHANLSKLQHLLVGGLDIDVVSSLHNGLFEDPYVYDLAKAINSCMSQ